MDDASLDDFLDAGSASNDEADAGDETATNVDDEVMGDEEDETPADEANDVAEQEQGESDAVDEERGESDAVDVEPDGIGAGNEDATVAPARSTMTFSPDPGECAACGESVSRRWTDGDALVCRDCKEW